MTLHQYVACIHQCIRWMLLGVSAFTNYVCGASYVKPCTSCLKEPVIMACLLAITSEVGDVIMCMVLTLVISYGRQNSCHSQVGITQMCCGHTAHREVSDAAPLHGVLLQYRGAAAAAVKFVPLMSSSASMTVCCCCCQQSVIALNSCQPRVHGVVQSCHHSRHSPLSCE